MGTIWVKVPPSEDPALRGKEICRKPGLGGVKRYFTAEPEAVEETPEIARLLLHGSLIKVDDPQAKE